jgi:hypothetical protein
MAFKPGTLFVEHSFCFIAILISVSAGTLQAQTSGKNDAYPFSTSVPPLSLCGQSADGCFLKSAALGQDGSNLNDADCGNSRRQDDWVHAWARKVDEAVESVRGDGTPLGGKSNTINQFTTDSTGRLANRK